MFQLRRSDAIVIIIIIIIHFFIQVCLFSNIAAIKKGLVVQKCCTHNDATRSMKHINIQFTITSSMKLISKNSQSTASRIDNFGTFAIKFHVFCSAFES